MEFAYIERDGGISWNPDFFSKDPRKIALINNQLRHDENTGWVPKGCGHRDFVIKHEAGHRVWWGIEKYYPDDLAYILRSIIEWGFRSGELEKLCKHAVNERNIGEAFADIYGAIYCMPKSQQPKFIRDIHKWLWLYEVPICDYKE